MRQNWKLLQLTREGNLMFEVDPIGWTKRRPSLDGVAAGLTEGGRETAIHSGLESALGSHPCVALSSYQAFPLYGKLRQEQKQNHPFW
jgi:hypothetical protein